MPDQLPSVPGALPSETPVTTPTLPTSFLTKAAQEKNQSALKEVASDPNAFPLEMSHLQSDLHAYNQVFGIALHGITREPNFDPSKLQDAIAEANKTAQSVVNLNKYFSKPKQPVLP